MKKRFLEDQRLRHKQRSGAVCTVQKQQKQDPGAFCVVQQQQKQGTSGMLVRLLNYDDPPVGFLKSRAGLPNHCFYDVFLKWTLKNTS